MKNKTILNFIRVDNAVHAGAHLQSQDLGGKDKRISVNKDSLVYREFWDSQSCRDPVWKKKVFMFLNLLL